MLNAVALTEGCCWKGAAKEDTPEKVAAAEPVAEKAAGLAAAAAVGHRPGSSVRDRPWAW